MVRVKNQPKVHITPKPYGGKAAAMKKLLVQQRRENINDKEIEARNEVVYKRRLIPGAPAYRYNPMRKFEAILPKTMFQRVVREILHENIPGYRYQTMAIAALQEGAETYFADVFKEAGYCCEHAGRTVVNTRDLKLTCRLNNFMMKRKSDVCDN